VKQLIDGFIAGLRAEIALLEEEGRDQSFYLTSGTRDEHSAGPGGVYVFLLSDPLRLPDDANGTLHVGDQQISALVVAQEGNRLWVLLESTEPLPGFIPQARLVLSQTDLLERLVEYLDGLTEFGIAPKVFGLTDARVQVRAVADMLDAAKDDGRVRQCPSCGGPLILVNQARLNMAFGDHQPLKWACASHAEDKEVCKGYLRRVDARAPFLKPPTCPKGQVMTLGYSAKGEPWAWRCEHKGCRQFRWAMGDVVP
jgi:hypothetical protein